MQCFQCKSSEAGEGSFCKDCGAPLELAVLVQQLVRKEVEAGLGAKFQDAKAVQSEWVASSVEKLSGWVKLFAFFAGIPVTLFLLFLGAAGYSQYSDFTKKVNEKVKDVEDSADKRKKVLESTATDTEQKLNQMKDKSTQLSTGYNDLEGRLQVLKARLPVYESMGVKLEQLAKQQNALSNKVDNLARDSSLNSLQPAVADLARKLIAKAHDQGIDLLVYETCRTQARQQMLANQQVTHVTAPGPHAYGLAFDVVKLENGQPSWTGDFSKIGQIGSQLGLTWGGDWGAPNVPHPFKDLPHFQLGTPEEMAVKLKTAKPCTPGGPTGN